MRGVWRGQVAKDRMAEAHKKRLEQVAQFAVAKSIPGDLKDKMFKYMQFQVRPACHRRAKIRAANEKMFGGVAGVHSRSCVLDLGATAV